MTALEAMLRANGFACRVETRDTLAILVPDESPGGGPAAFADPARRATAERLLRSAGFTHVAVELRAGRATLPRD